MVFYGKWNASIWPKVAARTVSLFIVRDSLNRKIEMHFSRTDVVSMELGYLKSYNRYSGLLRLHDIQLVQNDHDKIIWEAPGDLGPLTLSHVQTHFDAVAADDFWKHCGQRWICSWWAISPLATMFSTLFNNWAIFKEIFQVFVIMFSKSSTEDLLNVGKG